LVDLFTLALTHGLMAIALWRLLFRPELDQEDAAEPARPWRKPAVAAEQGEGDA
jgi:hypothetical protein